MIAISFYIDYMYQCIYSRCLKHNSINLGQPPLQKSQTLKTAPSFSPTSFAFPLLRHHEEVVPAQMAEHTM